MYHQDFQHSNFNKIYPQRNVPQPQHSFGMTPSPHLQSLQYGIQHGLPPSSTFTSMNLRTLQGPPGFSNKIAGQTFQNNDNYSHRNTSFNLSSNTFPQYSLPGTSKQGANTKFQFNNKQNVMLQNNSSKIEGYTPMKEPNEVFVKPQVLSYNTPRSGFNTQQSIDEQGQDGKASSKKNDNAKIRLFTGTAERVIKWHKVYNDYLCYYELIGAIVSLQEGSVRLQKIMLLRDRKGPIIQVVHYVKDHIKIENFFVGQMLRCVGRMVGPTTMHGLSIREATEAEIATLQRMCYISDHAITKALTK